MFSGLVRIFIKLLSSGERCFQANGVSHCELYREFSVVLEVNSTATWSENKHRARKRVDVGSFNAISDGARPVHGAHIRLPS